MGRKFDLKQSPFYFLPMIQKEIKATQKPIYVAFSRLWQKSKTAIKSCSGLGLRIIKIYLKKQTQLSKKNNPKNLLPWIPDTHLENSMDRGDWWTTVHGTKSWTQLSD